MKPVTNWVIADLSIKEGRALVMAALKQMVTMSVCNNRRDVASLGPGSADYLSARFARGYFFAHADFFSPFSPNAGPGLRLYCHASCYASFFGMNLFFGSARTEDIAVVGQFYV